MFALTFLLALSGMKKRRSFALLSRFVIDKDGNRIGESISVHKDLLIIKRGSDYYAVPLAHVEEVDDELRVRGVVQWERARDMAQEWKRV
ncbi:MAG TPA: hypothetical protein ENN54_00720 [Thermoplasmatales archaeon]|nr:hypothetical protein [Thermoplasmatales archaeon]